MSGVKEDIEMKFPKRFAVGSLVILAALMFLGCGSETNPSAKPGILTNSGANPTATATVTPGPPLIVALVTDLSPNAVVFVSNSAGTTGVANSAATLLTQGVTYAMTTLGQGSPQSYLTGKIFNFGFPLSITGTYFSAQPVLSNGQTIQFNVTVNHTAYSASVTYETDPNSGVSVISGTGILCTWTPGLSNENFVGILSSDNPATASMVTQIGPPLPSEPCTILNSAFTNETSPGYGLDEMYLFLSQVQTGAFAGSNSQSTVAAIRWYFVTPY
jgi:hypothetical protein